jgi:hypothetical protein
MGEQEAQERGGAGYGARPARAGGSHVHLLLRSVRVRRLTGTHCPDHVEGSDHVFAKPDRIDVRNVPLEGGNAAGT